MKIGCSFRLLLTIRDNTARLLFLFGLQCWFGYLTHRRATDTDESFPILCIRNLRKYASPLLAPGLRSERENLMTSHGSRDYNVHFDSVRFHQCSMLNFQESDTQYHSASRGVLLLYGGRVILSPKRSKRNRFVRDVSRLPVSSE